MKIMTAMAVKRALGATTVTMTQHQWVGHWRQWQQQNDNKGKDEDAGNDEYIRDYKGTGIRNNKGIGSNKGVGSADDSKGYYNKGRVCNNDGGVGNNDGGVGNNEDSVGKNES